MIYLSTHEWGRVAIGEAMPRTHADALMAATRNLAGNQEAGSLILQDHHHYIKAQQMVGVLAAKGCVLEILPKVDPDTDDADAPTLRARLAHMLEVVFDLELLHGTSAHMARNDDTLLDLFIRLFADHLLMEVRRGIPRNYIAQKDDLPKLRGRLDIVRQFSVKAFRNDSIACCYDDMVADTPLMRIMKACVLRLQQHTRHSGTLRKLNELRLLLAEVPDTHAARLPWAQVHINRSNHRWQRLFDFAKLFFQQSWQALHYDNSAPQGINLLFPMNTLFEAYITKQIKKALHGTNLNLVAQGGRQSCLGDWLEGQDCAATVFQTKPDIIIRDHHHNVHAIIDAKWKLLSNDPLDKKHGLQHADIYQLMAYARVYKCHKLMLLFPAVSGQSSMTRHRFGLAHGKELLSITTISMSYPDGVVEDLRAWLKDMLPSFTH